MNSTCTRTGYNFEAASGRQKVHPMISEFLTECNRRGSYGDAVTAIAAHKASGMEFAEFFATVKEDVQHAENERRARNDEERASAEAGRQAWRKRRSQNDALRAAGYRWHKEDGESLDAFSADGRGLEHLMGWHLFRPDGSEVALAVALKEIGR